MPPDCTVYVGGLPLTATPPSLIYCFAPLSATSAVICRSFGFVTFASAELARQAAQRRDLQIDGQPCHAAPAHTKLAASGSARPPRRPAAGSSRSIFVSASKQQAAPAIERLLGTACAELTSEGTRVCVPRKQGGAQPPQHRGYAFIECASAPAAAAVLAGLLQLGWRAEPVRAHKKKGAARGNKSRGRRGRRGRAGRQGDDEEYEDDFEDDDDEGGPPPKEAPPPAPAPAPAAPAPAAAPAAAAFEPAAEGTQPAPPLLARVAKAAASDAGWCESVCGFVRTRAAGPPPYASLGTAAQQECYDDYQASVEEALEVLLDDLELADQSEEFLMGLIGLQPDQLKLPPPQRSVALQICALDERGWFEQLMRLDAAAAAHPVRMAALVLGVDTEWSVQLDAFQQAHAAKFVLGGGDALSSKLDWAELHDEYQAQMEAPLEDVLQSLGIDAGGFLQELAANSHEAIIASPLPPDAIEPVRAFADYKAFEGMMMRAASDMEG